MVKTVRPIFRKMFQTVKEPLLILNTSCQIESINDFAADMLNIDSSKKQIIQLDELSKTRWNNFLNNMKQNLGGFCHLNFQIGESRFKEMHLMGYFHEKKEVIFARISKMAEIPTLTLQENNNSHIHSILNDFAHGIILTDLNGEIVDVNEKALHYIGYDKLKLLKKRHDFLFEALIDYEFKKQQYFSDLLINGRASIDVMHFCENGQHLYYNLESKLNHDSNLIMTTITDETEKRVLQQQIEQQQSLNSIGQMAASIAHEIRNPMTSLKGFVELIRLNASEDNKNYLSVMDSELERMESILSELLYLSKPKERKYEETSIQQVVDEVVELMYPHAMQHNIVLKIEDCDYYNFNIMGNANRLKQMLINLVKNSIEVMHHGGEIVVKLENKNDAVEISIKDEGTGMSETQLEQLFTPFYTTKSAGTGLGLALVKKVIEEHSGIIEVESEIGRGTLFKILFPISNIQRVHDEEEELIKMWMSKEPMDSLTSIV